MIENPNSRTALLCTDSRDGHVWIATTNSQLPDARLLPYRNADSFTEPLDVIVATDSARRDGRYGETIMHLAERLEVVHVERKKKR